MRKAFLKVTALTVVLAAIATNASAAGIYVLTDVSVFNSYNPTPTSISGGPIGSSGTATVSAGGAVSITDVNFSWNNPVSSFTYTGGNWSTTVGGTSITQSATCIETAGTPCSDSWSGLSGTWSSATQNDGITATGLCFAGNILNGAGNACDGISIVENLGSSLVITEQSQYILPGDAGGYVYTFTVIPVPAAIWLFASALGLLGWAKHKR